ncbi:hypothetical protein [Aridibaculum aurantiacum]|uniref:hypothetical protein n=1 Tax=Aridibaculum aurantiacum TaxID=2810307 RepID=UPI001A9564D0|nr:hypothetical protein [Aridibaculum aurantiacum]
MKENEAIPELPKQEVGAKTDIEASETLLDAAEARQFYQEARQRFLDVNRWHDLTGLMTASFQITDENGNDVNRPIQVRDHFKIDIPGPGNSTGDGYDWVQVERIEEKVDEELDSESIIMTVRPAHNPTTAKEDIAHFFSDDATSNFMLMREKNHITAGVHGRNEVPNTGETGSLLDKARNAIVGTTALLGFSNAQWSTLVNAWLGKK